MKATMFYGKIQKRAKLTVPPDESEDELVLSEEENEGESYMRDTEQDTEREQSV